MSASTADADQACRALIDAIGPLTRPSRDPRTRRTAGVVPRPHLTSRAADSPTPQRFATCSPTTASWSRTSPRSALLPICSTTTSSRAPSCRQAPQAPWAQAQPSPSEHRQPSDRPVVGVTGDGGFLFTATELGHRSAAQHPVQHLAVQQQCLWQRQGASSRNGSARTAPSPARCRIPDMAKLADAFGVKYWHADSPESLRTGTGRSRSTTTGRASSKSPSTPCPTRGHSCGYPESAATRYRPDQRRGRRWP